MFWNVPDAEVVRADSNPFVMTLVKPFLLRGPHRFYGNKTDGKPQMARMLTPMVAAQWRAASKEFYRPC